MSVKLFSESPGIGSTDNRDYINLVVLDTGAGMSQQFMQTELFTPFRQADHHSVGTGLGLSIVKSIAKELHASLDVKSELGQGTSVTVRFPAPLDRSATGSHSESLDPDDTVAPPIDRFHVLDIGQHSQDSHVSSTKTVLNSVANTASGWLGCPVSFGQGRTPSTPSSQSTVYAMSENDLQWIYDNDPSLLESFVSRLASERARIVVIGRSVSAIQPIFKFEDFPTRPVYVHQP